MDSRKQTYDFEVPIVCDEYVLWLQVPMYDEARMHGMQREDDLCRIDLDELDWHPVLAHVEAVDQFRETAATSVLKNKVEILVVLEREVLFDDARVRQLLEDVALAEHALNFVVLL